MSDTIELQAPDWYIQFVADYSRTFGVHEYLSEVMVRAWWPAFAAQGFIERDFASVLADLLSGTAAPRWDREHLPLIRRGLNNARTQRTRRDTSPTAPEGARCLFCGGSGWVEVPHPVNVRHGTWQSPFTSGSVACTRCPTGSRMYQAACDHVRERPMRLDDYERLIDPGWADHLKERQKAERLTQRAEEATEAVVGPNIIRAVANGFRMPRKAG